ncbi:hypothetical protein OESDEN_02767 [Oesophagostomum dentatum]|uniref:Uncharacterized protein n=1 Tax=Oesophagostomum dentatum TaxID=61180 RepID=A0A0B1TJ34_OESDE|nr:hypothetical protein OESDEN_02767 [Oesophagostomum dentatum]
MSCNGAAHITCDFSPVIDLAGRELPSPPQEDLFGTARKGFNRPEQPPPPPPPHLSQQQKSSSLERPERPALPQKPPKVLGEGEGGGVRALAAKFDLQRRAK